MNSKKLSLVVVVVIAVLLASAGLHYAVSAAFLPAGAEELANTGRAPLKFASISVLEQAFIALVAGIFFLLAVFPLLAELPEEVSAR